MRKAKKAKEAKKDQAWFEQKVGELGAALKKLPADRQEQLIAQELEKDERLQRLNREDKPI